MLIATLKKHVIHDQSICKFRYEYIIDFSKYLVKSLKLESFTNIDLAENISYKLAGYNVRLNDLLLFYSTPPIKQLLRIPHLNKFIKKVYNIKFPLSSWKIKSYEIDLNFTDSTRRIPEKNYLVTYDHIYFATMNNYLNSLIPVIEKNKGNYVLILPREAKNWINYDIVTKNNINHIFLENIICMDKNFFKFIKSHIKTEYKKNRESILHYGNIDLTPHEHLLKKFIFEFLPIHIIVINELEKFLKNVSSKETHFHIARDRRALENAFVQIANNISGNTNMHIHGMLSWDICAFLWVPGRFENCKNIFVWGTHDYYAIKKRQEFLNKKIPNIIINGNPFLRKIPKIRNEYIVFIAQPHTNKYIPYFSKNLPPSYKMIARLHPEDKDKLQYYKQYETKNFTIDSLTNNVIVTLSKASVVISHYSTAILDAMYNSIPVFFLDFKGIRNIPNIFLEVPQEIISRKEVKLLLINEKNWKDKLKKVCTDKEYREHIVHLNNKILRYFVKIV